MNFPSPQIKIVLKVVRGLKRGDKRTKSLARIVWGWLLFVFIIIGLIFVGIYVLGQRTKVVGSSMLPTLAEGDTLLIDRISYRLIDPKRYDIVVFPFRYQDGTYYIKRVIALPGETVQISDGAIYINGGKLEEPYSFDPVWQAGVAATPVTLSEDEYFVLGDNRNDSSDSREPTIGNIKREDIEGRVWMRLWPADSIGIIH